MTTLASYASYEKLRLSMRYWLLGRRYFTALEAMEFAAAYHTGTRKDGTPEFSHQIWQAHYLRTLETSLLSPETCLATTFLHDVVEDYPVRVQDIADAFGPTIAASVERISKVVEGTKKDSSAYFAGLARDPVASVCKGVDRIHNHQSMLGAFSRLKQLSYMDETEEDILPMLKIARRAFPAQEAAYENIKHFLMTQIELIRAAQQPQDPVTGPITGA
jgi:(p)ppGpp synthase/HD superfamily hydrolase